MCLYAVKRRLPTLFLLVLSVIYNPVESPAQSRDALATLRADWHLCGIAEYQSNWRLAIETYQKVIQESVVLPLSTREWYRGTAAYGIARCSARIADSAGTRSALAYAASHHFWNFPLIRLDTVMVAVIGASYLDSLQAVWTALSASERDSWLPQVAVVHTPSDYDHSPRWPLLIALHGGNANYESFATRWKSLADTLGAVIVVPAGELRESQITNSWGDNVEQIASEILPIVRNLVDGHLVDSNQVYLAGFSQGAQATLELTLRYPHIFHGGIALSGFSHSEMSDSLLNVAKEAHVRLYAITGQFEDATFRSEIGTIHARCQEAGIPFTLEIEPGMIHEVPLDLEKRFPVAWKWVRTGLLQ